jgi:hypothetical protein
MHPRGNVVHAAAKSALNRTLAEPILSVHVLSAALQSVLRSPWRALSALALVLSPVPRHCLTNLAAYPKALWMAEKARALGVTHPTSRMDPWNRDVFIARKKDSLRS